MKTSKIKLNWGKATERWLQQLALYGLWFYRNYISCFMLPRCRFYPSCSVYAQEAIGKKGLWPGLTLAVRRLLRCHPLSRSAYYDPVK